MKKKLIRNGVFETNSSSTHCISISDTNSLLDTIVPHGGTIHLSTGEFGWEFEKYNDPETKLSYLFTHLVNHCGLWQDYQETELSKEEYDKLTWGEKSKLDKKDPETLFNLFVKPNEQFKMLECVLKDHTGAIEIVLSPVHPDSYSPFGYIDHQSYGIASEAFENEEKLRSFIFSPESWLCTGNDNDSRSWDFSNGEPTLEEDDYDWF